MPLVEQSHYNCPWWGKNGDLATIIPAIFRRVKGVNYIRRRMTTPDGDFVDLDWLSAGYDKVLVLLHGLEGSSYRAYMMGMAKYFHSRGWDIAAYNCRGCSGEINKEPRLYHHGDTDDVDAVISHINQHYSYKVINMIGFSMGGSLILNYLGNHKHIIPDNIHSAVVYSVPCDLKATSLELSKPGKGFYRKRFLKKLAKKIRLKAEQFPKIIDATPIDSIDSFYEFENKYTAPLHGFEDADAFYQYATANNYLEGINIPVLIVNAANDPMLSAESYPIAQARLLDQVFLEIPDHGGHVGFSYSDLATNWMEERAFQFVNSL